MTADKEVREEAKQKVRSALGHLATNVPSILIGDVAEVRAKFDAYVVAAESKSTAPQIVCKGRITCGDHNPSDCNWPFCDCDPRTNKVIEALQESGVCLKRNCESQRTQAPSGDKVLQLAQLIHRTLDAQTRFVEDVDDPNDIRHYAAVTLDGNFDLMELATILAGTQAQAAQWKLLPDEQAWWWRWNGEDYAVPYIHSVLVSKTGSDRYFIGDGKGRWCDEIGGFWLKVEYPNVPDRKTQAELIGAPVAALERK